MQILVTAGNTQTPIDRVRSITNIFTGKTGTLIALEAWRRGHSVCLLTSHPEVVPNLVPDFAPLPGTWEMHAYRTFDDLERLMRETIAGTKFDAIVHCAAVSDYRVEGVYAPPLGVSFDPTRATWNTTEGEPPLVEVSAGKVKSHHAELWLRMVPTAKLIDRIREAWSFRGKLVKFKLEVGVNREDLIEIAAHSREQSGADFIVANTLEEMTRLAFIGDREGEFEEVVRMSLPRRLLEKLEA